MAFAWSYSRWSTWAKCPAMFKYRHIDKLPEPPSPALEKGRKLHDDIAGWLDGKTDQRPDALRNFTTLADGLKQMPAEGRIAEKQIALDRELRPVSWFGRNAWFRAAYDVLLPGDKEAQGVDWKSGRRYATYTDQQQIFALGAFWSQPGLEEFTGHWVYLDSAEVDSVTFTRDQAFGPSCDPAANEGLHGLWMANVAMMEADRSFRPTPSKDSCRFCPFHQDKGGPCTVGV